MEYDMVVRAPSRSKLALAALAAVLASGPVPVLGAAQSAPGAAMACPGRVTVIEAIEHPNDLDAAGTGAQRFAW
ncbi:MAG: hypothetical protein ACXVAM_15830, partial [Vulcanimicrobiaceae bacterium]